LDFVEQALPVALDRDVLLILILPDGTKATVPDLLAKPAR